MQTVQQLPGWAKAAIGLLVVGAAQGIIGGRADAIFVWALPLLWRRITLLGGDLLFIMALAWVLGIAALHLLHKAGVSWAGGSSPAIETANGQLIPTLAELGPREKAEEELEGVLQEIAAGNTDALPSILPRLRYIFDRLGMSEDAAWCSAELHGYPNKEATPKYRYADIKIDWNPVGGVASMNLMTGEAFGQPPTSDESVPVALPVEELSQIRRGGRRSATGRTVPGVMGAWREVAELSPESVQGVLRRIMDEAYRRALAARTTSSSA